MTEKEAIYILRNAAWLGSDADRQKVEEAVEVVAKAIEALNHSEIPNSSELVKESRNIVKDLVEDDTISRKAAIDAIFSEPLYESGMKKRDADAVVPAIYEKIKSLPSVQPETAKRIVAKSRDGMTLWYQCDTCNEPVDAQDNYCRGCGRRLIDETD